MTCCSLPRTNSNPSRNCWSRKAASGLASRRLNRSRRNSSAGRSIPGASTRSSRDWWRSAPAGTRCSGTWRWCSRAAAPGSLSVSPASATIARSGWEWPSAPSRSESRSSSAWIPLLRRALREKRISYEKARIIARHADGEEVQGWIEKAETMTSVALRRAMQDKDEAQMCARGTFTVWMPVSVAEIVKAAFRAARAAAKRWLGAGECLVTLAEHFVDTWRRQLKQANTLQRRIRARDRHFCQVPGCSRAAVHAHHIKPRSQGGSDDPENLISLCTLCRARHKAHYAEWWIMPRAIA